MRSTLMRSLLLIAVLSVPLAAGGMYAWSKKDPERRSSRQPPPCACCCEEPSREQLIAALADEKDGKTDCPMFGGTPLRNMVNLVAKNTPTTWSIEDGKRQNIKWMATLGKKSYAGPIIAGGKVYVGTNNAVPRDPKVKDQRAVLMAFDEADGKFLWQITHKTPPEELFDMGKDEGLCSAPLVEGDALYYVTPACEVVRADTAGKVTWTYDMMKELGVVPFHLANCAPLIAGDLVMVITGNGTDGEGVLQAPKAPSFIAVNKKTGKLAWQSSLPGKNMIQGQWSNPSLAVVQGKPQVIFPGGDGVLYSLEPETGKLIWKVDCIPDRAKRNEKELSYFISTAAIDGDRLYIGMGVGPDLGTEPRSSYVFCIDLTKTGDASPKNFDAADPANKGSALVWAFGGPIVPRPKTGLRPVRFGCTISTCAIHDGLVYAAEEKGYLHCLDAKTGQRYWDEDLKAGVWGSPYYVDGKIYIGTDTGAVFVFAHGKTKKEIGVVDLDGDRIDSTPVVANGVLYIMTRTRLIAVAEKK